MAAAAVAGVEALAGAGADRADRVRPAWAVPEARADRVAREVPGREAIDVTRGVPDPAVPGARVDREVRRPD